jgi:very-short-patch-repair endonuclease
VEINIRMQRSYTLRNIARHFRKNPTKAEALLWKNLRAKQVEGLKFRRQHPIDGYIVDFACLKKRIVIEADGVRHSRKRDLSKDGHLKGRGFKVLRFWDEEIMTNAGGVLEEIRRSCR